MVALHMYCNVLQVVPVEESGKLSVSPLLYRLDHDTLDMCFFDSPGSRGAMPTLAVLSKDPNEERYIKTCSIDVTKDGTLADGPWGKVKVDRGCNMLIPVHGGFGGIIIIGSTAITYFDGTNSYSASVAISGATAWGSVDATRYLLSDADGTLFVIVLKHDGSHRVVGVDVQKLGSVTSASCISYVDSGIVFVGSCRGDSQIIRLTKDQDENGSYIETLDSHMSLGPIQDMVVVDLDGQGQGQVITCSGVGKEGSLRVVRNGISIEAVGEREMPGMKGVWSLRPETNTIYIKFLVVSFVGQTRILSITDEQLDETEIPGFRSDEQTLFCGNMLSDTLVQVTSQDVRMVDAASGSLLGSWTPPDGARINVAAGNRSQVLVATGGKKLVLLTLDPESKALTETASTTMDHEVACIDISIVGLFGDDSDAVSSPVAAVGLWDVSCAVLSLPSLSVITAERLPGEVIPRSVLVSKLSSVAHLLCGLGDGLLYYFELRGDSADAIQLKNQKRVSLGTQPVVLTHFDSYIEVPVESSGKEEKDMEVEEHEIQAVGRIFASCDRPAVIYSSQRGEGKLLFSNINMKNVAGMCSFNCEDYPDSLVLATEEDIIIGSIDDETQKLHIRSIPLEEHPRRIAFDPESASFAVATLQSDGSAMFSDPDEKGWLRLLDCQSFEALDGFVLEREEKPSALHCMQFMVEEKSEVSSSAASAMDTEESASGSAPSGSGKLSTSMFVLGTVYVRPSEDEPQEGRILVFQVVDSGNNRRLELKSQVKTNGGVYSLCDVQGKLVAGINSCTQMYTMQPSGLTPFISHKGHVLVYDLASIGDSVVVADLMQSMTLLSYNDVSHKLVERARHFDTLWLVSIGVLSNDVFIGAPESNDLIVLSRDAEAVSDEDRARLVAQSVFHLGEQVNRITPGSLVMKQHGPPGVEPTHILGTSTGGLYVLASVRKQQGLRIKALEVAIAKCFHGIGGVPHSRWRSTTLPSQTLRHDHSSHFIDGDLVESFLKMSEDKMAEVRILSYFFGFLSVSLSLSVSFSLSLSLCLSLCLSLSLSLSLPLHMYMYFGSFEWSCWFSSRFLPLLLSFYCSHSYIFFHFPFSLLTPSKDRP